MKAIFLTLFILLWLVPDHIYGQDKLPASKRPKIGVALSGGGAKGISHIGVLKAIENAGLKVDFITGTSMGAIIGGYYALGYSAEQLKEAILKENWDKLFASRTSLDNITLEEKSEYSKYMVEIPIENWKFQPPKGFIDSHELLLEFSRLASRNYTTKKFSELPIPFQCFATDVATGNLVALDSGNLALAIRASMAIPSIFAPVRMGDQLLVDGGLMHNLPASDLKKMGADIIIGVNLSTGLMEVNQLSSFGHILFQSLTFLDARNKNDELSYCNILIEPTLTGLNAGSFNKAPELLQKGEEAGKSAFPVLKKLADSLNSIYEDNFQFRSLHPKDTVTLGSIVIHGLKGDSKEFLLSRSGFYEGKKLHLDDIPFNIGKAMSSNYFKKINYELEANALTGTILHLYVEEQPNTFLKGSVNYNTYGGIGLIANISIRNLIGKSSRLLVSTRIAQNFRSKVELYNYIGKKKLWGTNMGIYYDIYDVPIYEKLRQTATYFVNYVAIEPSIQRTFNTNNLLGWAVRGQYFESVPRVTSPSLSIITKSFDINSKLFFNRNSLNKAFYPKTGGTIDLSFTGFFVNNVSKGAFSPDSSYRDSYQYLNNYYRIAFHWAKFIPVSSKLTFQYQLFNGFTINKPQNQLNAFVIGGLADNIRNQVQFVGLKDFELFTNNFQMFQIGLRYEIVKDLFLLGRYNMGNYSEQLNDTWSNISQNKNYVSGYGITIAYNSILGPIELTAMRCEQLKDFRGYLNVGFNF